MPAKWTSVDPPSGQYEPAVNAEASEAVLNPAYYPRRFKPEVLWSDSEKAAFHSDPTVETEGRVWAGSVGVTYPAGRRW